LRGGLEVWGKNPASIEERKKIMQRAIEEKNIMQREC
jgi:hypothetical protein